MGPCRLFSQFTYRARCNALVKSRPRPSTTTTARSTGHFTCLNRSIRAHQTLHAPCSSGRPSINIIPHHRRVYTASPPPPASPSPSDRARPSHRLPPHLSHNLSYAIPFLLMTLTSYFTLLFTWTHIIQFCRVEGTSMAPLLNADYDAGTGRVGERD